MYNRNRGFSLIELLVVVVVIGIIAVIAIPGLLASRRNANEGSAISTMRLLHGSQMTYASTFGVGQFAGDIGAGTVNTLIVLRSRELIDPVLATGIKSGYIYVGGRETGSAASQAQFFFSAIPLVVDPLNGTGDHRFGISTDGVLRSDTVMSAHYANVVAVTSASTMGN